MRYYVLQVVGDVEPFLYGPFDTGSERDAKARELRAADPEGKNGLYRVYSTGRIGFDTYLAGEFPTIENQL